MPYRKKRKCLACGQLYLPDVRVYRKQKYCAQLPCQQESHRASQARWFCKPENRDYYRDPHHVDRVRRWQEAHPDWRDHRRKGKRGLHDVMKSQAVAAQSDAENRPAGLHDLMSLQPPVVLGLVASLTGTGTGLHDEIEEAVRKMHARGQAILGKVSGAQRKAVHHEGSETSDVRVQATADFVAVQLGGSQAGAG